MSFSSALAIYVLFWTLCLFLILPFGVRTPEEAGTRAEVGHAESAPHVFRPWRIVLRTTMLSAVLFGLFYANYLFGWVTVADVDFLRPPSTR